MKSRAFIAIWRRSGQSRAWIRAKADALEAYMEEQLEDQVAAAQGVQPEKFPTVAEIEARIEQETCAAAPVLFASNRGTWKKLEKAAEERDADDFSKRARSRPTTSAEARRAAR